MPLRGAHSGMYAKFRMDQSNSFRIMLSLCNNEDVTNMICSSKFLEICLEKLDEFLYKSEKILVKFMIILRKLSENV